MVVVLVQLSGGGMGDVKTWRCQNLEMSKLRDVKTGRCQNLEMSKLGDVKTGRCQNLEMSKLGDVKTCLYNVVSQLSFRF